MSLCFVRPEFILCATCAAKPGSPALCVECLERRELHAFVVRLADTNLYRGYPIICSTCMGYPDPECKEHGR